MGDHTRLTLDIDLRPDTPAEVLAILRDVDDHLERASGQSVSREICVAADPEYRQYLPQHPMFLTEHWPSLLYGNTALDGSHQAIVSDRPGGGWHLSVHTAIKNSGDEIDRFLDWLAPWVPEDCAGKCGETERLERAYEGEFEPDVVVFGGGRFNLVEGRSLRQADGHPGAHQDWSYASAAQSTDRMHRAEPGSAWGPEIMAEIRHMDSARVYEATCAGMNRKLGTRAPAALEDSPGEDLDGTMAPG